jgi:50S ribosomal protein L16 3-hydroxylase
MSPVFGSLTPQQFLERHWQRAPLMFRGALPDFRSPISADELAGLACEESVESRLVQGHVGSTWRLEHGPFDEARFERLPERDWTLLVQDVDKLVPELGALLERFRFIPDWRIDDIMVSFAAPGGSVGPHTDQYDVFLLQAQGRRRWQLSENFDGTLLADVDLKILEHFEPEQELIAEPGDILYLPPNVAHFGVALDEAMTFSIGFRAPDQRELMVALADELALRSAGGPRFSDPARSAAANPSRLDTDDLARLRQMIRNGLSISDADLDRFIGRHLTQSKPHLEAFGEASDGGAVSTRLRQGSRLVRRLGTRWAHFERGGELWLFVGGQEQKLEARHLKWIEPLIAGLPLERATLTEPDALPWLVTFLEQGAIEWQDEAGDD